MAADPHLHARLYGGRPLEADHVPEPGFAGAWDQYQAACEAQAADRPHVEARQAEAAAFVARNEAFAKARRSAEAEARIRRERASASSTAISQAFAKALARDRKR